MMPRKQNALLRGFTAGMDANVAELLASAGYQIAQTLAGADLLVVGPEGAGKATAIATERRIAVVPWVEMEARLRPKNGGEREALERLPVIQTHDDHIRVLDLELPLVRGGIGAQPAADRFAALCFDEPLLRAIRAVAMGAVHGLPTALEGDTAASKTTAVLWLAHIIGQPVVRLNLNGQTDTGELVGRYVPARDGDDWDLPSLRAIDGLLQQGTREILAVAETERRSLSWGERVVIGRNEGIHSGKWRFQEGAVPLALRHGWWVLLDELNLAEPQILERLNPALEDPPTFVLSEGDQTAWGPGASPVGPGFRMFATLNPAEYAGRSVLSPAFRDRWTNWFHANAPGERDYHAHLRLLAFGEQPEVVIGSRLYQAPAVAPVYPELSDVPDCGSLMESLARFHCAMAKASAEGGTAGPSIGRNRRERYVFSRRALVACIRIWCSSLKRHPETCAKGHLAGALRSVYLDRFSSLGESRAAAGMAKAAGLPSEIYP